MLLAFPSQKDFVLVFRGGEAPSDAEGFTPIDSPANFLEDSPIPPIDSAIEPKEVGGITIAQKLDTAGQPDMPESAIASGCIDFVLSPEDIAQEIVRIAHAASPVQ